MPQVHSFGRHDLCSSMDGLNVDQPNGGFDQQICITTPEGAMEAKNAAMARIVMQKRGAPPLLCGTASDLYNTLDRTGTMNPDQQKNLDEMVEALGKSMAQAWSYFYVLKGIHEGAKGSPVAIQTYPWVLDQLWRGMFDAFFAKVGTLIDSTASTYSLPNLITLVRRYGDAKVKALVPEAEACLSEKGSALAKIKNWRHSQVAHRSVRMSNDFHLDNKMDLGEIEVALHQLDAAINHLTWNVLSLHNDTSSAFEGLIEEGKALLATVAKGSEPEGKCEQ